MPGTMKMSERHRTLSIPFTYREWQFFAAVIAANLVVNVAAMWVEDWFLILGKGSDIPAGLVEAFSLACLFTQLVILAIWATLFSGSNLLRVLLATLALCVGAYFLMWLANRFAVEVVEYRSFARISGLPFLVVVFFTVQTLFWALRFMLGWRIVLDLDPVIAPAQPHQYSILHILGWMLFLSVVLGLGQVYHGSRSTELPLFVGSLAILSWLYGIPYLCATLRAKRVLWALAICVPLSIATTLIGLRLYLMLYPWTPPKLALQAFLFVQSGVVLTGVGTGIAARLFGYRLVWPGHEALAAIPNTST
jgi:hypothetical protein